TLSGLELFYPRLVPGGYCFVHDFNNPESNWACRRALTGFMAGRPERVVELPDKWGSAVVPKALWRAAQPGRARLPVGCPPRAPARGWPRTRWAQSTA